MASDGQLKRLAPVATAASAAATRAGALYATSKTYVPARLQATVEQAEGKAASLASPYVALISDKAVIALKTVDAKVDGAILSAWQSYTANAAHLTAVVEAQRAARGADLEAFNAARAAYLKKVEESVAFVKEQGLQGTAKVAAEALASKVEEAKKVPEVLLHEISAAWGKLSAMPAVERLVASSKVQVDAAYGKYKAAHDALVADPRYGAAVAKGGELLASLQATAAYKAAWTRLTPLLGLPAAQSAAKIAAPYVTAVAGHLAPVAA
ncbi:hypothetical protein CHLNCDRAFT_138816 [Chlorella variabilis]|uniref:Uncharacterized protein n=1 Tax=Chlorella variabilis TaxID=554065 RepID=E1ZNT8_CHLVA|nr:hypothetical protein CHLNCDRAFT_138816 [Chlorella variabilis]EFN52470.1 hypothetical protein CHLNCDRAFT_138816 [Chlorella variabilis]|eukprot:XP_005844572.1 hypothetical protein CHLNCDRAFT_138816 [Chlorella variabilis]